MDKDNRTNTISTSDLNRPQEKKKKSEYGLKLYYQPIVDPVFSKTVAYEGLIRLLDKSLKFVSPAVFIPIAEKNGLEDSIGNWVVDEACRMLNKLKKKEMSVDYISVNVSSKHFLRKDYVNDTMKILKRHEIEPYQICLEVAEYALASKSSAANQKMSELRELGFILAIDGFGGEFTALSKLAAVPADIIKLDKQFVDRIMIDPKSKEVTQMIIDLAKKLDMKIIAMAVEDTKQQGELMKMGCNFIQGFLHGAPMKERDIIYPKKKTERNILQTDLSDEEREMYENEDFDDSDDDN